MDTTDSSGSEGTPPFRPSTPRWLNAVDSFAATYNQLEAKEHDYRGEMVRAYGVETSLWLEGLTLIHEASRLPWNLMSEDPRSADLQVHLFMLGASATKTGLDAQLGCQYPAGQASHRLALECALTITLVEIDPSIVDLWERARKPGEAYPRSPSVRGLVKRCASLNLTDDQRRRLANIEMAQTTLDHMSAGSHPTGLMMWPMDVEGVDGLQGYPVFSELHSVIGFKNGMYATTMLLSAVLPVRHGSTAQADFQIGAEWYRRLLDLKRRAKEQDNLLTARLDELNEVARKRPGARQHPGSRDDE